MSYEKYSLEIISHHSSFKNKSLRKYSVDGVATVGAWGDEPFEIRFKNNTWQKIQVKLTVDGTDILTGEAATTEVTNKMWLVNGYETLSLKAWPENNNGGAQLVFTSATNSVALHTHGDLSSRGIIAAAVYIEGYVAPTVTYTNYPRLRGPIRSDDRLYGSDRILSSNTRSKGGMQPQSNSFEFNASDADGPIACNNIGEASSHSRGLETLVAVGAGKHIDQHITEVPGLIKPVFYDTVKVKYMWWDELQAKLREANVPGTQPSGFPADSKKTNINLGATPRIGDFGNALPARKAEQPVPQYLRV